MDNTEQKKLLQTYLKKHKEFSKEMTCYLSAHSFCDRASINSHSISRTNLKLISENNHLVFHGLDHFKPDGPQLVDEKISLRKASTFAGFCQEHDSQIFKPIDQKEFNVNPETVALIFFRCAVQELFKKLNGLHAHGPLGAEIDPLLDPEMMNAFRWSFTKAAQETFALSHDLWEMVSKKNFSPIKYLVFKFDDILPYAFSSVVNFEVFSQYNENVDHTGDYPESALICLVPMQSGSKFILAWRRNYLKRIERFTDRILLGKNALRELFLQIALEHVENTFYRPSWYDQLIEQYGKGVKKLRGANLETDHFRIYDRPLKGVFDETNLRSSTITANSLSGKNWIKAFKRA